MNSTVKYMVIRLLRHLPVIFFFHPTTATEGKTKGQVIVCIMRKLVNIVVYKMMKNKDGVCVTVCCRKGRSCIIMIRMAVTRTNCPVICMNWDGLSRRIRMNRSKGIL